MNIKNLLNRFINQDIKDNQDLLDDMCNQNIDNPLCNSNLIKKSTIITNDNLYNDIEVFEDFKNNENTVFNSIDKTYTNGGQFYLKELLNNPLEDYNELLNRKNNLIKIFENIKTSENELQKFFIKISENEKSLFWIFSNNTIEQDNLINILYFNNFLLKYLNNSSLALTVNNIYNIFMSPFIGIMSPIIGFIVPFLILRFKLKVKFNFITYLKFMYNYYVNMNFGNMFGNSYLNNIRKIWYAFTLLFYFNGIFNSFQLAKLSNNINMTICSNISNCAIFIKNGLNILDNIYNKELFSDIFNINYNYDRNKNLIKNLDNLNITNYEYFNNFGEKLKLYKLFKNEDYKLEVTNIINLIYLSDTLHSLYSLYNLEDLSYPNYFKQDKPVIEINDLRHPNIDKLKVVKNDIYLDNNNNLVITGPNAGGKSTFIKSIAINILLSQTICMSYSTNINITPFHYIASQMTIIDHKGVESLFEAEMNRIINNINIIKECNKLNKKSIIFLDELFNSTNVIEGICGSYGICKHLSDINTNITLLTTHFTYLYKLKDTNKFKNYKMNVKMNNGVIEFPYKISEGISTQYIALELLNNSLDNCKEIIETSLEFKKDLINKFEK